MKNGEDCYCYENIPFADLQVVPSENETISCSSKCKGGDDYLCGGPEAVSIYVASKIIFCLGDSLSKLNMSF